MASYTQSTSSRIYKIIRSSLVLILLSSLLTGIVAFQPTGVAEAAVSKVVSAHESFCVRPGGTSYTWSYGTDFTPDPAYPGQYPIVTINYDNVIPFGWILTRGHFEYSTNGGGSWTTYTLGTYEAVSGKLWRFVDTTPGDTTTSNSIGVYYTLQGPPGTVGSGTSISPDNAPTDISSDNAVIMTNSPAGTDVATLSPTDTGCYYGGYWEIVSQSVSNLFTLSFDSSTSNSATLSLGSGTMPAAGGTATVTVKYYDLYQTDASGNPIAGQGFSKVLTFNIVADSTQDLNFSNDDAVSTVTPVYVGYARPAAATLSTGNYVTVWTEFGHGGDAMASTGASYDYGGIYDRLYNSTGTASGAAFGVTPVGDGVDSYEAAVAALNAGRYVAAYRTGTSSYDVGYRIIEANGTIGSELIANTTTTGDQTSPAIATLTDGSFVITWASGGAIYAQKFNSADGSKNGSELTIHSGTSDINPAIAALNNGDYAVAWADSSTGNISAIVGSAPGTVISVSSDGGSWGASGSHPGVASLAGGGFVVVWDSYANDLTNWTVSDIFFQRYTNSGVIQGSTVQANTVSAAYKFEPGIAALSGGGFVIAWQSDTGDYDSHGIFGRRFTSTGVAVDVGDFEINQYRKGDQIVPDVTALAGDLFAAVWEANPSSYYSTTPGIYTRALLPTSGSTCTAVGSGTVFWSVAFASCPPGAKFIIPNGLTVVLDNNLSISEDLEVQAGGALDPNGKTVTLTGSTAQTLTGNPLTFYRLDINKTNKTDTVTISGKLKVTKKLAITKGKLISASDYGDIEIEADGELELTSAITVSGNFTNTGTLTTNGFGVTLDGGVAQNLVANVVTLFDDLTVSTGTTMIETVPDDNVVVMGTLTNNGVIRKSQTVTETGAQVFGLTGVEMDVTTYGGSSHPITVDWISGDHTHATTRIGIGSYFNITDTGGDTVDLTLPHDFGAGAVNVRACRYTGAGDTGWECGSDDDNSNDDTTVTRLNISAFSDWAPGRNVGPTVVELNNLNVRAPITSMPAFIGFIGLALAGCISSILVFRMRRK